MVAVTMLAIVPMGTRGAAAAIVSNTPTCARLAMKPAATCEKSANSSPQPGEVPPNRSGRRFGENIAHAWRKIARHVPGIGDAAAAFQHDGGNVGEIR
jgi:hypothetical protein